MKGHDMKKAIVLGFLLLTITSAHAQGIGDSLIVNLKNGKRVAIPLSDIRKITFDTLTASVAQASSPTHGLDVSPSFPNPSHAGTNIDFDIATAGSVNIAIYDSKGNLIRHLQTPNAQAGHNRVVWDGLDEHGAAVASGVYFYEVRFKGEMLMKKTEVVR